jgi:hypothetical protein
MLSDKINASHDEIDTQTDLFASIYRLPEIL